MGPSDGKSFPDHLQIRQHRHHHVSRETQTALSHTHTHTQIPRRCLKMAEEDASSATSSLRRLQSVLKSVFSPRPERAKQLGATVTDRIQKSAVIGANINSTIRDSNDNAIKANESDKTGIVVLKYKHASVQTDMPSRRTLFCATPDVIESDAAEIRRLADIEAEKKKANPVNVAPNPPHSMKGTVGVRRPSNGAAEPISLPKPRARSIKFEKVAILLDAATNGDMGELRMILEGPSALHVDSCTSEGVTALHVACSNVQKYAVSYLISLGAHINVTDSQGNTPLHLAAAKGDLTLVQTLIQAGASVESLNAEKNTPAQSTPFSDVREYIKMVAHRKLVSDQVTAIYDFNKHTVLDGRGDEINLQRGEVLRVIDRGEPDWWLVERRNGERGYVPKLLVQ